MASNAHPTAAILTTPTPMPMLPLSLGVCNRQRKTSLSSPPPPPAPRSVPLLQAADAEMDSAEKLYLPSLEEDASLVRLLFPAPPSPRCVASAPFPPDHLDQISLMPQRRSLKPRPAKKSLKQGLEQMDDYLKELDEDMAMFQARVSPTS